MSLSSAKPAFQSSLLTNFSNTANTAAQSASNIASATHSWAIQGVPMTIDTGIVAGGQTVAAFVTTTPGSVSGSGSGGIDTTSPGSGLAAAKANLVSTLQSIFVNTNNSANDAATGVSNAIDAFFSEAKIMTSITGSMPPGSAVPAPAGPVVPSGFSATGSGGIDSSSPGAGLSAMISSFQSALQTAFMNIHTDPLSAATAIGDAVDNFLISANISTIDSGTAGGGPAVVDPSSGTGVTSPPGSPIISAQSSSGTIS